MNQKILNITEEQRNEIISLLDRYLPDVTAWIFGSRIKHSARQNSDLDLVVFADANDRLKVHALRDAFDESNIPFRIDMHVWNELPDIFKRNIETNYVVLQKNHHPILHGNKICQSKDN
ncbi:MAG: nucleotidyltransferase domain-containing protein [Planctomycetaceae bacterium]|jgi:predicted nucleotidyltransferase|nr:nucleotidyltransferase domain-containing protein [Planctomycetaceae bacterium]